MIRFGPGAFATLVVAAVGCGGGDESAEPAAAPASGPPVTVSLREERGSGQSGTATLRAVDAMSMTVVIELTPSKEHSYLPAHIHTGTCADYAKLKTVDAQAASVADELQDVRDGRSESTLYTTALAQRTTGTYSINVHVPVGDNEAVACGDIPKRG